MKKTVKQMALAVMASVTLWSCSGSGDSNSDSLLFGALPGEYLEFLNAKESLREQAKTVTSESQFRELQAEAEEQEKEWSAKIEKAAKSLDGRTIAITDGSIKVVEPLTLTFDGFFSKIDLTAKFMINGKAEAAENISPIGEYPLKSYTVYIVGYDAQMNELFASNVGRIDAEVSNHKATIPAGTPVVFDYLQFGKKKAEAYGHATMLKLEARYR